jgi:hypothetical protein
MTIDSIRRIVKWRPIGESSPVQAGVLRAASVREPPDEKFARKPFDRELPRFRVPVRSAFVAEVCAALDRAGVAAERSPISPDGAEEKVTAVVEAEDASTALRKVLVIVGPSRLVGPIERVRDSRPGE